MDDRIYTLDCTLRDGGYYNDWDFPLEIVQQYLDAMSEAEIDFVEIGFRALPQNKFLGAHAFTTESYLKQFSISNKLRIGVMLNAGDILSDEAEADEKIDEFFDNAEDSPIHLVRIACHYHEYEAVIPAVHRLIEKGYLIGLNLMQIAVRTEAEIKKFAADLKDIPLTALYIADSTGSLDPIQTEKIIEAIKEEWDGPIGVHFHDNMGLAVSNSLAALNAGATFLDSTVTGMGRGPGNAQTEYIIANQNVIGAKKPNPIPLLQIISSYFSPLKEECGWGKNYFYHLAGQYRIHPTYIQEMLEDNRYDEADILQAIEHLQGNGSKFNREMLDEALHFFPTGDNNLYSDWHAEQEISGREVLIVASGDSVSKNKGAIERFIKLKRPYVIAVNTARILSDDLIDLRVACNPRRILSDFSNYVSLPQPVVVPLSSMKNLQDNEFPKDKLFDYGVLINQDLFEFGSHSATLPYPLGIAYALAIANSGASDAIYVAGVDGYHSGDKRNFELEDLFVKYSENGNAGDVISLTPTIFKLPVRSVHSF